MRRTIATLAFVAAMASSMDMSDRLISAGEIRLENKVLQETDYTIGTIEEIVFAGNLYFYKAGNLLTPDEYRNIAHSVKKNFEAIGIKFKSVDIIENRHFPNLEGLDILIYLLDSYDGSSSRFGISDMVYNYSKLKSILTFSYDEVTSEANTGYIIFDKINEICRNKNPEYDREQMLIAIIQLATHEIGHGLGAPHDFYIDTAGFFKPDSEHFMGEAGCKNEQYFYYGSTKQMKGFIKEIQERIVANNIDKNKIIEIRESYLTKPHFIFR